MSRLLRALKAAFQMPPITDWEIEGMLRRGEIGLPTLGPAPEPEPEPRPSEPLQIRSVRCGCGRLLPVKPCDWCNEQRRQALRVQTGIHNDLAAAALDSFLRPNNRGR